MRFRGRAAGRLPSGSVHRCSWGVKARDENDGTTERIMRKAGETHLSILGPEPLIPPLAPTRPPRGGAGRPRAPRR
ncbi:hypothetical protein SGM_3723 [Streptomyces griseoaurantiacus M045]|uniref:Uncharacterized protein n=1 Tax=Streptomyces griseoaurantiacus M045 TaxID=996637 RepID=F3NKQ9_9ACTN|nr:hypothetical protein SGM_3723 [Streptomyces griseoaurantiacus M045]